jgi:hypothetical protein
MKVLLFGLLVLLAFPAAAAEKSVMKETIEDKEVEIAPGEWITVKKIDVFLDETLPAVRRMPNRAAVKKILEEESTEFIIPWKDKTVRWKGHDIPLSLREWENKLYIITFDRSQGTSKCRFRYHAQDGDGFKEIKPDDYPKRIATQNLWLKADSYSTGMDGRKIYDVAQAVNIDPEDGYFYHTLTAKIWCQLMTGKEYWQVQGMADPQPLLREFAKKHNPIKLTAIIRAKAREEKK